MSLFKVVMGTELRGQRAELLEDHSGYVVAVTRNNKRRITRTYPKHLLLLALNCYHRQVDQIHLLGAGRAV